MYNYFYWIKLFIPSASDFSLLADAIKRCKYNVNLIGRRLEFESRKRLLKDWKQCKQSDDLYERMHNSPYYCLGGSSYLRDFGQAYGIDVDYELWL